MYYFSYGSNMSSRRLLSRTPSASLIDTGLIRAHRLLFHKISHVDGSAKCDAFHTGNDKDIVYGVLFSLASEEKPLLDKIEGLGIGYEIKKVLVETGNGTIIEAFSYYATHIDKELKPYSWYKQHVLHGAYEHGLPSHYISKIERIETIVDTNRGRHEQELAIYNDI